MLPHIATMDLLSNRDMETQLSLLRKYRAAYNRLPRLNVTAFNLNSAVPLELTEQLLDLGCIHYEHWGEDNYGSSFSMEESIPTLRTNYR